MRIREVKKLIEAEQDLFEINMSPSNLKKLAAETGAMAGMEFEMIVPNADVDEDPNYEPDYDQDQRTRSFSDIRDFFYDGDYNGRRDVDSLEEELMDQFGEWREEQIDDAWESNGFDYLKDYIEGNDIFDFEEANEEVTNALQAEYGDDISLEDFQKMLEALVKEKFDEFVQSQWDEQGRWFDEAREQFQEEQRDEIDESDWLRDNYPHMTDIVNNFDIAWPYYIDTNEGGETDIETVADDFRRAVGMKVNWSSSYHGGRREPNAYVVEPDGSLEGDNPGDGGLEFVSPPMPIDKMIEQLNKVKAWAGDYGAYTNRSTGLHINISVPNYDLSKLDYVKLALLLGDKYVLDQFGRSSNTYTKSALGKVQDLVRKNPESAKTVLDKMRGYMEDIATKAIHTGSTDKYTSINTKSGYIEFRSPGGDWLDANFDKIENTLLRFTVALSAAMNPEAYREEYLKKLYKLLEPTAVETKNPDTIKYFADYVAGKTPKAALRSFVKQAQLERKIKRGQTDGKTDYWWRVSNPTHSFGEIEVVAKTKEEAIEKALAPDGYPSWANTRQSVQAVPVRPYDTSPLKATVGEPQPAGGFQWELSQTDIENRLGWPDQTGDANYEVVNRNTLRPVFLFVANTDQDAQRKYSQIIQAMGMPEDTEDYGYRARGSVMPPIRQQAVQPSSLRPSNPDGNYVIFSNNSRAGDPPAYRFMAADNDDADTVLLQWSREHPGYWEVHYDPSQRLGQPPIPGSTLDLQRQRAAAAQRQTPDQRQGGLIDVSGETPAPQPLGAGRELVGWEIRIDGQPVHTLSGIGNNQGDANRLAQQWILRQGSNFLRQHQGGEVEVVPAWREA